MSSNALNNEVGNAWCSGWRTAAELWLLVLCVLGLGAWALWVQTHLVVAPLLLLAVVGLWAGLLHADDAQRGRHRHALATSLPLVLGPVLLVTADLVGRSVSGELLGFATLGRFALVGLVATALLTGLVHFVSTLALGLDRLPTSKG